MMNIETISRPAPEGPTAIPQELAEWLTAKGYRWSWQSKSEEHLSMLYGQGFEPLPIQKIQEQDPELYQKIFEGEAGTKRMFVTPDSKYVQAYDAVLMIQPQVLWERKEKENRERLKLLEARGREGSASDEEIADALRTLGIRDVKTMDAPRALEDIVGDLAEEG